MFIFPVEQLDNFQAFAYGENVFTKEECTAILALLPQYPVVQATVGTENAYKPSIRNAEKVALAWRAELDWIFRKLMASVLECNQAFYRFQLTGFLEELEVLRYGSGGFFNWHMDFHGNTLSMRKLSLVVQLAEPTAYEGGDLEILTGSEPIRAPRGQGTVIVFPSFVMHRVSPVTAGERLSLVAWVSGPPYR